MVSTHPSPPPSTRSKSQLVAGLANEGPGEVGGGKKRCAQPLQVSICTVTIGHRRVTVGYLRVSIGHLRVTTGYIRFNLQVTSGLQAGSL